MKKDFHSNSDRYRWWIFIVIQIGISGGFSSNSDRYRWCYGREFCLH